MSHRLYFTSYLLVYYFMQLDGAGDSQRFVRYFREITEARLAAQGKMPNDATLQEMRIEGFFPADPATELRARALCEAEPS